MLSLFKRNRGFFDDFFEDFGLLSPSAKTHLMKTDITENDTSYNLLVELPGYNKDDVKVSLEDGYLLIEAHTTKNNETKDEHTKYLRQERYVGSVKRSYYVGNITLDDITGTFENGILNLSIPKTSKKEPVKQYLELK